MSAAVVVALLWVLFAATHMGLSSQTWRPRVVADARRAGLSRRVLALALLVFTALVWFYVGHRHQGTQFWAPSIGGVALWAIYAVQGVAWSLVVAGVMTPSPAAFVVGDAKRPEAARGVHLLTRHPVFMGAGIFGALHLFAMGFASDVAFWAGFPLFALIGCAHQDRRKLATEGADYRAWHERHAVPPLHGPRDAARPARTPAARDPDRRRARHRASTAPRSALPLTRDRKGYAPAPSKQSLKRRFPSRWRGRYASSASQPVPASDVSTRARSASGSARYASSVRCSIHSV